MYEKKEYRTLRAFAKLTAGFGWLVVGIFFLTGFGVGSQMQGSAVGTLIGVLLGFVFGVSFVVSGQLVSVFLDQKELLEGILAAQSQKRL